MALVRIEKFQPDLPLIGRLRALGLVDDEE